MKILRLRCKRVRCAAIFPVLLIFWAAPSSLQALDYKRDIMPIFEKKCFKCHSEREGVSKGSLTLDEMDDMEYAIGKFAAIVPNDPDGSDLVRLVELPRGDTDAMPPDGKGDPLTEKELALVRQWISEGAILDARNMTDEEKTLVAETKPASRGTGTGELTPKREYLDWTNAEGRTIKAAFLRLAGDKVEILMENGVKHAYPLDKLSAESQETARKLADSANEG